MRFSAVFFDLDDTLVDNRTAERHGLQVVATSMGIDPSLAEQRWSTSLRSTWHLALEGRMDVTESRRQRIRAIAAPNPISDFDADQHLAHYQAVYRQHWKPFPEVLEVFGGLLAAPGLALAVVTNGMPDQQADKLRAIGLPGLVPHLVTPAIAGFRKPHSGIFHYACTRFGCLPEQCIHVGDHFDDDVVGAKAAGLTPVWLRRNSLDLAAAPGHDCIDNLYGLADILELPIPSTKIVGEA